MFCEKALQSCAFRRHDEFEISLNRGNVIKFIGLLAELNEDVKKVVLDNAPKNVKYVAPSIQEEILSIMANKVCCKIRDGIGYAYFLFLLIKHKIKHNESE
ncbi:hypothetical protein LINGRAPRIM_LOCUS2444 [Linum grandiflorum]